MNIKAALLLSTFLLVQAAGAAVTLVSAGYVNPQPIKVSPGQVVTFFLTGVTSNIPSGGLRSTSIPLLTTLGGISAIVHQPGPVSQAGAAVRGPYTVPILSVDQMPACSDLTSRSADCLITAVTVQVPFEMRAANPLVQTIVDSIGLTDIVFTDAGTATSAFLLLPVTDNIHVITSCDANRTATDNGGPCSPVVTHGNGQLAQTAKVGEELVAYAFGLGATNPAVISGQASPSPAATAAQVRLLFAWGANSGGVTGPISGPVNGPDFVGLTAGFVGLYQLNFHVPAPPAGTPACLGNVISNLAVTFQGLTSYDVAKICVATP